MATNEYRNTDQSGIPSDTTGIDEPRRTTESTGIDTTDAGYGGSEEGGYGGVSESEPPQHKTHSEDEPLPKPTGDTYDDQTEDFSTPTAGQTGGGYGDDGLSTGTKATGGEYGGDDSTEKFQDSRSDETQTGGLDGTAETQTRSYGGDNVGLGAEPGIGSKSEEPGYGQDTTESAPKGFVQKLKEKLPGKSKSDSTTDPSTDSTFDDTTPTDTGTPKKGLITKIKEKLPGHHTSTDTSTDY